MAMEKKERIPVKVRILTVIRQMDAEEQTEMTVSGVFYKENDSHYLQYEENQEAGKIRTVWKSSARELLLLRSGVVSMRMHFLKNKNKSSAHVNTGAGKIAFETELTSFQEEYQTAETPFAGNMHFQYELISQAEPIGSYTVTLKIEEDNA